MVKKGKINIGLQIYTQGFTMTIKEEKQRFVVIINLTVNDSTQNTGNQNHKNRINLIEFDSYKSNSKENHTGDEL